MAWFILLLAGICEIGFTTCLKLSKNFSDWRWSLGFFVCISLSFFLLNKSIQSIPMGTAYAVWTGIGAVGTVIVGIILYDEPTDILRMLFLCLLVGSIIGLKLVS